jgi:hypothetical protein
MKNRLKEVTKLRQEALHNQKVAISADPAYAMELQIEAQCNYASADELEHSFLPSTIVSGEVVLSEAERPDGSGGSALRNTLANPDTAAIVASMERTELLTRCGTDVLALGIDAAQSIPDANSLEKMLAHQMALAHKAYFRVMESALEQRDSVEMARLINASCRLTTTFQQGLLAINRVRNGGKQTVTVQHVNINGGQTVVTGNLQPGGSAQPNPGGRDEIE